MSSLVVDTSATSTPAVPEYPLFAGDSVTLSVTEVPNETYNSSKDYTDYVDTQLTTIKAWKVISSNLQQSNPLQGMLDAGIIV